MHAPRQQGEACPRSGASARDCVQCVQVETRTSACIPESEPGDYSHATSQVQALAPPQQTTTSGYLARPDELERRSSPARADPWSWAKLSQGMHPHSTPECFSSFSPSPALPPSLLLVQTSITSSHSTPLPSTPPSTCPHPPIAPSPSQPTPTLARRTRQSRSRHCCRCPVRRRSGGGGSR